MKVFVSKDFKIGVHILQKKHNKEALEDLKNALIKLKASKQDKVTFNNNHHLTNTEYNEMHIGGQYSDILFVWRYDEDTKSCEFILKGRDIISHKELKRKNYKNTVYYEEFDINKLNDTEYITWIYSPELLDKKDFIDEYTYRYWLDKLETINMLTSSRLKVNIARNLLARLDDIKVLYIRQEIEGDLNALIESDGDKRRTIMKVYDDT